MPFVSEFIFNPTPVVHPEEPVQPFGITGAIATAALAKIAAKRAKKEAGLQGCDELFFDLHPFNKKTGLSRNGFYMNGLDEQGYDELGYDWRGYNKTGVNRNGYNRAGFFVGDCDDINAPPPPDPI